MDLGRPPLARFPSGDAVLREAAMTRKELEAVLAQVRAGVLHIRLCDRLAGSSGAHKLGVFFHDVLTLDMFDSLGLLDF